MWLVQAVYWAIIYKPDCILLANIHLIKQDMWTEKNHVWCMWGLLLNEAKISINISNY